MKRRRLCVFCGARKVSKEHVIPSWVDKVLPSLPPGVRLRHTFEQGSFEADALSLTVKRVCRECNHGWMEQDIESPNRPILTPMFLGKSCSLTPDEQEHVATWAVKTQMMAQYRHLPHRPVAREQLQWLYENVTVPPKSRVWLAGFAGELSHRVWGRTHNFQLFAPQGPDLAASEIYDAEMMTLCVGHLVFQVLKWTSPEPQLDIAGLSDETTQFMLQIWPTSNLVLPWPPNVVLDTEESLSNFAHAFMDAEEPPTPPPTADS
jgi:hypothetical protein